MAKDQAILKFPESFKMVKDHLKTLTGYYWFEVRKCRDQRTLSQNAFLHGVWLPIIARRMTELWGESTDIYVAKELLKNEFLRTPLIDKETGEIKGHYTRGTRDLDKAEFSEFMDRVSVWALRMLDEELPEADTAPAPKDAAAA
jgi:hypothetical protein